MFGFPKGFRKGILKGIYGFRVNGLGLGFGMFGLRVAGLYPNSKILPPPVTQKVAR